MKPSQIKIGTTYKNRGQGRTQRTVLDIGDHIRPSHWWSPNPRPNEPGVLYEQEGRNEILYLSSFASWCGGVVNRQSES